MASRFEELLSYTSFPDEIKAKIRESKDLRNMLDAFFSLYNVISTNLDIVPDRFEKEVKLMVKMYVDAMHAEAQEAHLLPILIKVLWVRSRLSLAEHIPTTTDAEPHSLFQKICAIITIIDKNNKDLVDHLNALIFKFAETLIRAPNVGIKSEIINSGWYYLRLAVHSAMPEPTEEWQRKAIEELSV